MSIEHILKNLGSNKVTVDISTNKMNEMSVFQKEEIPSQFVQLDNLLDFYKTMTSSMPRRQITPKQQFPPKQQTPTRVEYKTSKAVISDPFMYVIASYIDKTLSLFKIEDVNKKVEEFKKQLSDNLINHNDAYRKMKLKTLGIELDDLQQQILSSSRKEKKSTLIYVSKFLKKNIVWNGISEKPEIIKYDEEDDNYVLLKVDSSEDRDGFRNILNQELKGKVNNLSQQNLKKMLVKDLKIIAQDFKIDLFKIVDGKKTTLLKEELVEKISAVINRSI